MTTPSKTFKEVELKFQVPDSQRAAVAAELAKGATPPEQVTLAAMYLDTPDRRLAKAGIAWRLRREGKRWVQTLKASGGDALSRFEHEVLRPGATHDAQAHLGTEVGKRLIAILDKGEAAGSKVGVRFETRVKRTARRVRTKGAVVEVAFDQGRVIAGDSHLRLCEVEFELISGSPLALLAIAERWRKRHGLIYDPRTKAERGDRLAQGFAYPPLRKAREIGYPVSATPVEAFASVLDECIMQVVANATGILVGSPDLCADHVHQLRVGIRRLRSALKSFEGLVPEPPAGDVRGLRAWFATLGDVRDGQVLDAGVAAAVQAAGGPPLTRTAAQKSPDPAASVRAAETQRMLLSWLQWRAALTEAAPPLGHEPAADGSSAGLAGNAPGLAGTAANAAVTPTPAMIPATRAAAGHAPTTPAPATAPSSTAAEAASPTLPAAGTAAEPAGHTRAGAPPVLAREAEKRLRRLHKRIATGARSFASLDDDSLHALRKRTKRQRYAVEFFSPVLRRRQTGRYLKRLAVVQDAMGQLNDLFVARERYQQEADNDAAAWFALGWIAARIDALRAEAGAALETLADTQAPRARASAG